MKVALGVITHNEEKFLKRHLPILVDSFDGLVVVDHNSTDGTDAVLSQYGAQVHKREWNNNFSDARNETIKKAEDTGFDWLVMLDADECMFPDDIAFLKEYLSSKEFLILPRIEFVDDNLHYMPSMYPDRQGRVFKLNIGYHFRNPLHEVLFKGKDSVSAFEKGYGIMLPQCPIYHYGRCRPVEEVWLKHHNYDRLIAGKPRLEEFPKGQEVNKTEIWPERVPFFGRQPL